jgi:hypothetical protein
MDLAPGPSRGRTVFDRWDRLGRPANVTVLETLDGPLSVINGTNAGYLGIYRPRDGADPVNTRLLAPETGLSILDVIPAIGTKFNPAEELGPQSQKAKLSGTQTGRIYLQF